MKKIKVYLAGGWFDEYSKAAIDYLESFLDIKFQVFSPRRETKLLGNEDNIAMKKSFDLNITHICEADIVIASTVNKDTGTLFECGVAYANEIPIIYTFFDDRFKDVKFNMMLAQSAIACFTEKQKFEDYINTIVKTLKIKKQKYEGEFE